tara:strand:+ start:610 stop:972 length:363 start_codon:yes stop_codon:yes gene_type:complete
MIVTKSIHFLKRRKEKMSVQYRLNINRLFRDLGGPSQMARYTGHPRTSFYRWINSDSVNSKLLEDIKTAFPDIELDFYFEPIEVREVIARTGHIKKGLPPRTIDRELTVKEKNALKTYHK